VAPLGQHQPGAVEVMSDLSRTITHERRSEPDGVALGVLAGGEGRAW